MPRFAPLLGLLLLGACAARSPRIPGPLGPVGRGAPEVVLPPADTPATEPIPSPREERGRDRFAEAVVRAADHYLRARPARDDCSGYVCAVFTRAGLPLKGNSRSLWEDARAAGLTHKRRRPAVGDLAFFDNTYDRNRNGRWDDDLTHVAIVLSVDDDGTIVLAHGGTSKGRTTMVMNLFEPDTRRREDGKELNDFLRARRKGDPRSWKYLSGQLWRGFATISPDRLDG